MITFKEYIHKSIKASRAEEMLLLPFTTRSKHSKGEVLSDYGDTRGLIHFIEEGFIRVAIRTTDGKEKTFNFALEGDFICDLINISSHEPTDLKIECISDVQAVSFRWSRCEQLLKFNKKAKKSLDHWVQYRYLNLDRRIKDMYNKDLFERFLDMDVIFPGVVENVPQFMIAEYLGTSNTHISRLKKKAKDEMKTTTLG